MFLHFIIFWFNMFFFQYHFIPVPPSESWPPPEAELPLEAPPSEGPPLESWLPPKIWSPLKACPLEPTSSEFSLPEAWSPPDSWSLPLETPPSEGPPLLNLDSISFSYSSEVSTSDSSSEVISTSEVGWDLL